MQIRNLIVAAAAFSALAGAAQAQSSTSANVPAKITFVAPVAVTQGEEMRFGSFTIPTTAGGSIVLGTDGAVTASGGGVFEVSTSAPQAATFDLGAAIGTDVTLTVAATSVASGYTLGSFQVAGDTGCSSVTTSGSFQFTGASCTIAVGGTLGLPATATAGEVTVGTVVATLAYQ